MTVNSPGDATEPREIVLEADGWTLPPFPPDAAVGAATAAGDAAAKALGLADGHGWAVLLADDAVLARLNADYRGKDQPTNVLSFPAFTPDAIPSAGGHLGDIAIAVETVIAEALDAGKSPIHHLAHMVIHGVAHLAGLDHEIDAEAATMEALEVRALAKLGMPNPYEGDEMDGGTREAFERQ